jgi:uncharacterized integral membrane protein (TIGR00697 family)
MNTWFVLSPPILAGVHPGQDLMRSPYSSSTAAPLRWLVGFHILIIAASNYLVQIPISVFGFHSTWGTFTFPLIFLATDLAVRTLGATQARRVVFLSMLPALAISYLASELFVSGEFLGWEELRSLNDVALRIALASLAAYAVGQLLDIFVFNRLRQLLAWWVAPTVSTTLGALVDTFIFFSVAFYASSNEFMAQHWIEIAWIDYFFKLLVSVILFVPIYGFIIDRLGAGRRAAQGC